MGWLLAFVFAAMCGLLAVFLFVQWDEKRQAVAKLQASAERLQFLEKQDADLTALRTERDALARALLTLREAAGELEHVRRARAHPERHGNRGIPTYTSNKLKTAWSR